MDEENHSASRQAGLARDAVINQITLDPILPAFGAPGMADQVFNLRSLPANLMCGFTPDHATIERSTLRTRHGDILK